MEYLSHHVNFEILPALCKFPILNILFSTVKLKSGLIFSQFIYKSKIGIFESYTQAVFTSFWQSQRDLKLEFLNIALPGLDNFSRLMVEIENYHFETLAQTLLPNFSCFTKQLGNQYFLKFPYFHVLSYCKDCLLGRVYVLVRVADIHHNYVAYQSKLCLKIGHTNKNYSIKTVIIVHLLPH